MLVFVPAFLVLVGVVLVGALHAFLGYPLGEAWAAEVWGLARTMIFPTLVAASFGIYVSRQGEAPGPHTLPPGWQGPGPRSLRGGGTGGHRVIQLHHAADADDDTDEEHGR